MIRTGELKEAEGLLNQAIEDLAASGSSDPELQVRMDQIKGLNAFLSGDLDTAERLANDSLKMIVQIYGPGHLATTEMQQMLATILVAKDKMTEAYDDFDAVRRTVFNYVQQTLADLPVRAGCISSRAGQTTTRSCAVDRISTRCRCKGCRFFCHMGTEREESST